MKEVLDKYYWIIKKYELFSYVFKFLFLLFPLLFLLFSTSINQYIIIGIIILYLYLTRVLWVFYNNKKNVHTYVLNELMEKYKIKILRRNDLIESKKILDINQISLNDFNQKSITINQIRYLYYIVFSDNNGDKKILKDRFPL
jgi:hypothetical protein